MITAAGLAEPQTDTKAVRGRPGTLIRITGHLCPDCRFVWVCRLTPRQVPYLDPESSPTLGRSARAFVDSTQLIRCAVEADIDHGGFTCLICRATGTWAHKTTAYLVP